jgi:hypothetical protein
VVDFVGRFENFAQDLSYVFDRLGLEAAQLEIPHENRSAHDTTPRCIHPKPER